MRSGHSRVQRLDDGHRVAGAVEEIGIAEGDVLRAGGDLAANVFEHDIGLHDAKHAAVDGYDGAVAAEMLAAARRFGVAHTARAGLGAKVGVGAERRQAGAVGDEELLARE